MYTLAILNVGTIQTLNCPYLRGNLVLWNIVHILNVGTIQTLNCPYLRGNLVLWNIVHISTPLTLTISKKYFSCLSCVAVSEIVDPAE